MKILIIEDEYNLADAIKSLLTSLNYSVDIDTDGETGLDDALSGIYDLIILDVMLPKKDGFEILKEVKKEGINTKIIMLTAKSDINDKLNGLTGGADDYMTKPFHMEELEARVNLQLRKNDNSTVLEFGNITLDIKTLKLGSKDSNVNVDVIGKEFQILEYLIRNNDKITPKELLFNKVWGYDSESEINSLEAYMSFLRKKLKLVKANVNIKTIRNMGYKLEVQDEKTTK